MPRPNAATCANTHIYNRVDYLLDTAKEFEQTYDRVVGRLRQEPWECAVGWMRSHFVEGLEDGWHTKEVGHLPD